ncbi:hypothetical protein Poly24_43090 [Rosistilla carotiformis]|uniref:Secreted protein n=1 Tax=Rosistilla carotiformis TaxID=2528017 RepID=A0A518JYH1_9BACT|nr:hypothetical protein [Rosistilla carotiformis]QDV70585.1 hypothetical protein Poly24_43090 [Rosistilla carotiformis]
MKRISILLRFSMNCMPLACSTVVLLCLAGCRSAAHNDVYVDKLAAEVRFLEDQLYQIDYENKVLREKLQRAKRAEARAEKAPPKSVLRSPSRVKPSRDDDQDNRSTDRRDDDNVPRRDDDDQDTLGPIETPRVDLGQPNVTPPKMSLPNNDNLPDIQLPEIIPGEVRPPSDSLLIPPQIDTGQVLPPGDARNLPSAAPGQVILPAAVNQLFDQGSQVELVAAESPVEEPPGEITSLLIDPAYSRGHDFTSDGETTGVYLVLKALDAKGREVKIDTPLKVAIMDPKRSGSQARLGRWDFDLPQVREAWRTTVATDGVHLPIQWDGKHPLGDEVDVYCRVETPAGDQITAELTIDLTRHRSRAELWTPRGN